MIGQRLEVANKKAKKVWKKYHGWTNSFDPWLYGEYPDFKLRDSVNPCLGVYRKTKVFCSNPFCCGNPRRQRGVGRERLTLQELRQP